LRKRLCGRRTRHRSALIAWSRPLGRIGHEPVAATSTGLIIIAELLEYGIWQLPDAAANKIPERPHVSLGEEMRQADQRDRFDDLL
jgi:hypothetical protein